MYFEWTCMPPFELVPLRPFKMNYQHLELFIYSYKLQIRCSAHTGSVVGELAS